MQSPQKTKSVSTPWLGNAPWALLPAELNPKSLRNGYGNRAAIS
ncbi:hypothetical protein [Paraglaciecola sp. L3A3]|nr:hypothetical protein [Paraglaciecola sp. L3A3]